MKQEEKNLLSRQRIMECAIKEFSEQGYGLSSVNTICSSGNISKGILYHYFKDKDEIYLLCVKECFDALTDYLRKHASMNCSNVQSRMEHYFDARLKFFKENPMYQRIFCDAIIAPPDHLENAIQKIKLNFDALNIKVLNELLEYVELRPDVTRNEVIDMFRQYQDFINARYQMAGMSEINAEEREKYCSRALTILLYGVIAREEN